MFSGITRGMFPVVATEFNNSVLTYRIALNAEILARSTIGSSIAIDGVCQTIVAMEDNIITLQAIAETLEKTTLNTLKVGQQVSIEPSLCVGDEIGGHEVAGHVHGTAQIAACMPLADNALDLVIACPVTWIKYIIPKGFIAVDGSSLTVGEVIPKTGRFYLHLIPETLRICGFAHKKPGDRVNIELDRKTVIIVNTTENYLANYWPGAASGD